MHTLLKESVGIVPFHLYIKIMIFLYKRISFSDFLEIIHMLKMSKISLSMVS